jgi:hypothetical protein
VHVFIGPKIDVFRLFVIIDDVVGPEFSIGFTVENSDETFDITPLRLVELF